MSGRKCQPLLSIWSGHLPRGGKALKVLLHPLPERIRRTHRTKTQTAVLPGKIHPHIPLLLVCQKTFQKKVTQLPVPSALTLIPRIQKCLPPPLVIAKGQAEPPLRNDKGKGSLLPVKAQVGAILLKQNLQV